jgi:hypothetical protein
MPNEGGLMYGIELAKGGEPMLLVARWTRIPEVSGEERIGDVIRFQNPDYEPSPEELRELEDMELEDRNNGGFYLEPVWKSHPREAVCPDMSASNFSPTPAEAIARWMKELSREMQEHLKDLRQMRREYAGLARLLTLELPDLSSAPPLDIA